MGNALDSGSRSPGSSPGRIHCVVFLVKTLYSHSASLQPEVYKWVAANLMRGGRGVTLPAACPSDELASHLWESRNTPSRFMLQKLANKLLPVLLEHSTRMQNPLPFPSSLYSFIQSFIHSFITSFLLLLFSLTSFLLPSFHQCFHTSVFFPFFSYWL